MPGSTNKGRGHETDATVNLNTPSGPMDDAAGKSSYMIVTKIA